MESMGCIAIAGGGIGGLACALALARRGIRVTVLEQASEFGEIGAGIQLAPNAWHALDALGVGETVKRDAVFVDRLQMLDMLSGKRIMDLPTGADFRERFGNPYAVAHRADIHSALLKGCRQYASVSLLTDSRVTGFAVHDGGVTVQLERGEPLQASGLVGADGLYSRVRQTVVGDGEPPPTRHLCYRAVIHEDDMPPELRWTAMTLWAGPCTHIVHYGLRGSKLYNLVATVERDTTGLEHNGKAAAEEVLPNFAHACEPLQKLLRIPKSFGRWVLRHRPPTANWCRGPVTLLGDAAHPMLQYFAQGACMAMEDAVALGEAVAAAEDLASAFAHYQELRLVRSARVQLSASMLGHLYHASGVAAQVRNSMYQGRRPEQYWESLDWLFMPPQYVVQAKRSVKPATAKDGDEKHVHTA